MPPIAVASGLLKVFDGRRALDGVSFELMPGEIFGLLGANGAGKTTLLRILLGLERPDAGSVTLFGRPIDDDARARTAYCPELGGLPPRESVEDVVTYFAQLKGLSRAEAKLRTTAWIERLDLVPARKKNIGALSKGNQQRAKLATTFVASPDLVLLDEPFSGLDPLAARLVRDILREEAARGAAIVLSTHELRSVEELCARVLLIDHGTPLLHGVLDAIRREQAVVVRADVDYRGCALVQRFKLDGSAARVQLREGVSPGELLGWLLEQGADVRSFEAAPSLEDIFAGAVERHRTNGGSAP